MGACAADMTQREVLKHGWEVMPFVLPLRDQPLEPVDAFERVQAMKLKVVKKKTNVNRWAIVNKATNAGRSDGTARNRNRDQT